MSSYRKTMAEALQEVSDKNKLKVLEVFKESWLVRSELQKLFQRWCNGQMF